MVGTSFDEGRPLRILHVLRAPIGGLWRHVVDLSREQADRGHSVGIIADALTGGARTEAAIEDLASRLSLGISRVPIRRNPHPGDLLALAHVSHRAVRVRPDVIHGHGSKGGVLARLAPLPMQSGTIRAYTPHGGSLNYRPGSRLHGVYMRIESALQGRTDLGLFESRFIQSRYAAYVGRLPRVHRVVHNGISPAEFRPVTPRGDATDLLYVGELRAAKGIDTLLSAVARMAKQAGRVPSLTLVGSGPDRAELDAQAAQLGVNNRIVFRDPMPARDAFELGRVLVVPSRAESLPYIVLEAAGACVPIVATNVGGIPEIYGPYQRRLIGPDSVPDLSDRMSDALSMDTSARAAEARELADHVQRNFSISRMVDGVLAAYRDVHSAKGLERVGRARVPFALSDNG